MFTIENQKASGRIKTLFIRLPFLLLLITGVASLFDWIPYGWLIGSVVLFLLSFLAVVLIRYQYVRINEHENHWEIRYYELHPLATGFRMIRIEKQSLEGTSLRKSLMGLRHELLIFEETMEGSACYPPLNVNLFTSEELKQILDHLKPSTGS